MKTPDEIKKGLECCPGYDCKGCTCYSKCDDRGFDCVDALMIDALAYIQQLEAELAAVKRERDAAVADLASIPRCKLCVNCETSNYEEPCRSCAHIAFMGDVKGDWKWRGVCPENTEVQEDE